MVAGIRLLYTSESQSEHDELYETWERQLQLCRGRAGPLAVYRCVCDRMIEDIGQWCQRLSRS